MNPHTKRQYEAKIKSLTEQKKELEKKYREIVYTRPIVLLCMGIAIGIAIGVMLPALIMCFI